ncbi:hypothetical protein LBMAG49_23620 [Planctomycetota bacterium]|nr:hypothetical protein LBMAG49_23620 [Planctomycetota bacterium]
MALSAWRCPLGAARLATQDGCSRVANRDLLLSACNASLSDSATAAMLHIARIGLVLLGFAASAQAQFRIEGLFGSHLRVAALIGGCGVVGYLPRVSQQVCAPRPVGHWETVCQQVWVPGYWRYECVPARFGVIESRCGRRFFGEIEPAHTVQAYVQGCYRTDTRNVWIAGR